LDFFFGFLEGFEIEVKHAAGEALEFLSYRLFDRLCTHVIGVNFKLEFTLDR
jgi:hypothetical protein